MGFTDNEHLNNLLSKCEFKGVQNADIIGERILQAVLWNICENIEKFNEYYKPENFGWSWDISVSPDAVVGFDIYVYFSKKLEASTLPSMLSVCHAIANGINRHNYDASCIEWEDNDSDDWKTRAYFCIDKI